MIFVCLRLVLCHVRFTDVVCTYQTSCSEHIGTSRGRQTSFWSPVWLAYNLCPCSQSFESVGMSQPPSDLHTAPAVKWCSPHICNILNFKYRKQIVQNNLSSEIVCDYNLTCFLYLGVILLL